MGRVTTIAPNKTGDPCTEEKQYDRTIPFL
jgi:hypothetical protein